MLRLIFDIDISPFFHYYFITLITLAIISLLRCHFLPLLLLTLMPLPLSR
jgi:hypothetical protein